jgi:hypothetical protein
MLVERAKTIKMEFAKLRRQKSGVVLARAIEEAAAELEGTTATALADKIKSVRPSDFATALRHRDSVEGGPLRDAFIRSRVLGFRARVLGTYGHTYGNAEADVSRPLLLTEPSPNAVLLQRLVDTEESTIREAYRHLHRAMRKDRGVTGAIQVARDIEASLRINAGILAAAAGAYVASLSQRDLTQEAIDLAVLASRILADAEVLYAYCSFLEGHATNSSTSWALSEARKARELPVATKLPRSTPVAIEQVLEGTLRKNRLYRLTGVVDNLRTAIDPAPPKFSSFLQLKSADTGAAVMVRAHMFSLANNGLADGMLCVLEGRLAADATWSRGIPGIDVERIALDRLRRSSWTDDVVFRMRPYSKRYPDEMTIAFAPIAPLRPEVSHHA